MQKSIKILGAIAILGIAMLAAGSVNAADLRYPTDHNQSLFTVEASDAVHNLYAAGGQLIIDANPSKDAVVVGGIVSVNGNTADDLIAAGGNINIEGTVGGSARVAGGTINLDSNVKEDFVAAGGNINILPKASVTGDVLVAGGNISINGPVHGNITVTGGSVLINSVVDGNVVFKGGALQLGPSTNIKGSVNYTSRNVYDRDPNAKVVGGVTYNQLQSPAGNFGSRFAAFSIIGWCIELLATIIVGMVLVWLFKAKYEKIVLGAVDNFWKNAGWGFLAAIAAPIVIAILFLTIIGYYLALLMLFWYIMVVMLAWMVGATAFGLWILKLMNRKQMPVFGYNSVLLAIIIALIIKAIPILGFLFAIVLTFVGIGSIIKNLRKA